jgi:dTDP-4-amino-4,6-dideoxygalactose transaminase
MYEPGFCAVADDLVSSVIGLPCHQGLSEPEFDTVCELAHGLLEHRGTAS